MSINTLKLLNDINQEEDLHPRWLADWRAAHDALVQCPQDTEQCAAELQKLDINSLRLCQTPAKTPEGLAAQIQRLEGDHGYYVTEMVGPDMQQVFKVLLESAKSLQR